MFSGIGGIDLAGEWAGIETVAFCEREPFPQKVLRKHWPNIPIYDDVRTLTKERLEEDGIDTRTIGIISAGYPCQPFSNAGQRKGSDDDRHLWPEVFRLIQDINPRWFVGENVAGHITLGLDGVLSDLESIGYAWEAFVIPACAVGAPHRRDRVFVIAHSNSFGLQGSTKESISRVSNMQMEHYRASTEWSGGWDISKPRVLGVGNGLPNRAHRTKALGNAVVPAQIYPILAAIKQIDDMLIPS